MPILSPTAPRLVSHPDPARVQSAREAVAVVARRAVKREAKMLRLASREAKLSQTAEVLDQFYKAQKMVLADLFGGVVQGYGRALGKSLNLNRFVAEWVARSCSEVLAAFEGPGTLRALGRLADNWEDGKVAAIMTLLDGQLSDQPRS